MDQLQVAPRAGNENVPASLDALPGELPARMVNRVRSWTLVEDENERERMRRSLASSTFASSTSA